VLGGDDDDEVFEAGGGEHRHRVVNHGAAVEVEE
jgi:hypothetical protein